MVRFLMILRKSCQRLIRYSQCPMPHAPCPMPNAQCPMPHAPCPMPNTRFIVQSTAKLGLRNNKLKVR
ncbi:hypothetical protein H6G98_18405 [Nostoc sp. FACHB-857]|nr:hypothetical protein [Nostoc sp. FACHB-857]